MIQSNTLIDCDHLEKYVVGDSALRDEILSIFVDQAQMLIEKFSVDQTDEGWRSTAHTLKGAARGVGAWDVGALCEEAEALIGDIPGKGETRSALLVTIRSKVSATIEEASTLRRVA